MKLQKLLLPVCLISVLSGFIASDLQSGKKHGESDKTVKIGLLISDNNSLSAVHGAEMAIRKANEQGGYRNKPFQLVVRSMEGPWGTGSNQAVSLIFEDNVCALMSSGDGRNGHLIEQVAAKTRIVYLSSWASDPTLAEAFVPWYFSCAPTDIQQADALIEEIYDKRKLTKIVAVSGNDYDSKLALENFVKQTKLEGKTDPLQLFYDNNNKDFKSLIDQINNTDIRAIVMFGKPAASIKLINEFRKRKMIQPLFGSLSLLDENDISDQDMKSYENVVFVSSVNLSGSNGLSFREEFQKNYAKVPGAVAAYSFDGINLLIEAIKNAGTERREIQNYLSKIHYIGVTGSIQFDDKGKRIGIPGLMKIKNGIPVPVEK
jgi:ABC-type branched-subunit amino acid transport system substrate-binding protein